MRQQRWVGEVVEHCFAARTFDRRAVGVSPPVRTTQPPCPDEQRNTTFSQLSPLSRFLPTAHPNTRRLRLTPIARFAPRCDASSCITFGAPTFDRNHLWNFATHSTQSSPLRPSRSKIGSNSLGIEPRFPRRICRPVQSSNARYSCNSSGRQPLFEHRRFDFFCRTRLRFGSKAIG